MSRRTAALGSAVFLVGVLLVFALGFALAVLYRDVSGYPLPVRPQLHAGVMPVMSATL